MGFFLVTAYEARRSFYVDPVDRRCLVFVIDQP